MRRYLRIPGIFHRAFVRAMDHDFFNLAQAAAYSAIIALFPLLIVAAGVIAFLPHTAPIRTQLHEFFTGLIGEYRERKDEKKVSRAQFT